MKCPTCESCEYAQYCGATEIMRKCDRHKKVEMTNEQWFCNLPTEEKAKWLNQQMMYAAAAREQGYFTVEGLIKWLKQPHTKGDSE